jgi:serine/threonine-protein kinase
VVEHRTTDPLIGATIGGDILITSVLGAGAMGTVYRGRERGTERDVAVKVLRRAAIDRDEAVHRFVREARIASRLRHPHIVEVFRAGVLAEGGLYIVMEHLDGVSLADALDRDGPMPPERMLDVVRQICDAVGEAHAHGIVHRDVKPENVMLLARAGARDFVKVLDFGIAKAEAEEGGLRTADGLVFGTPRYVPPEVAQGLPATPASDVYALATLAYQLLAGRTPFDADTPLAILLMHIRATPDHLVRAAAPREISSALANVIMANLEKDPARRAPDARAFARALSEAVSARATFVPVTVDELVAAEPPAPAAAPRRRSFVAAVATAMLVGAAIATAAFRMGTTHDAARSDLLARARVARTEGHFVSPANDNVHALLDEGLSRWPGDPALLQVRSDAARDLVTKAMADRTGGDVEGASDAARDALLFDPNDASAKLIFDQSQSDLVKLRAAGDWHGRPRLLFDAPTHAGPNDVLDVGGRVVRDKTAPTHAELAQVKLTVLPARAASNGNAVPVTVDARGTIHASAAALGPGEWSLVLEANVDGSLLRAERTVIVDG